MGGVVAAQSIRIGYLNVRSQTSKLDDVMILLTIALASYVYLKSSCHHRFSTSSWHFLITACCTGFMHPPIHYAWSSPAILIILSCLLCEYANEVT